MAGLDYTESDAVIIMDADMQHPISVIPEMLRYWEEGYDDIYAQRETSNESWLKCHTSKLYYRILQKSTNIPIQKDTGDFRLLDRKCIDALKNMRETDRNNKGMFSWIGFKKKGISYQQNQRKYGKTKWSYYKLLNLALTGITSFTTTPLRFASIFGCIVSLLAFIYLGYIIIKTLLYGDPVQGYPTLMVTILFLGGIQLIALGIIGEYLSHVFNETKKRPGYFINEYK
jgi:glycosyltransferase involved in cell wall biosynthesis